MNKITAPEESNSSAIIVVLATLVMTLSWLMPNHYPPWTSFYNESSMGIALLLFFLAAPKRRSSKAIPKVALVVLSSALLPWCQWAYGMLLYSGDAWVSTLYLMGFALSITVGYQWDRHHAKQLALIIAVATLAAAAVSSAIALEQVLLGFPLGIWIPDQPPDLRAIGNIAQSNHLAVLVFLGGGSLLYLRERKLIGDVASIAILLLLLLGMASTQSRIVLLLPIVVISTYLFYRYRRGNIFRTNLRSLLYVAILCPVVTVVFQFIAVAVRGDDRAAILQRGLSSLRFTIWPILIDGLNHSAWFGYGWLQVGSAQLAASLDHPPVWELYAQAHNLFLDLLIWCGYPLGLVLIALVVYWVASRLFRSNGLEATFGMMWCISLLVFSMFELPHYYAYFLVPTGLFVGAIECNVQSQGVASKNWVVGLAVVTGTLFVLTCRDYLHVEEAFRLARFNYLHIGKQPQTEVKAPVLSNLAEYVNLYNLDPSRHASGASLERYRKIATRYPYAKTLYAYAIASAANGNCGKTRKTMEEMRHIHGERVFHIFNGDLNNYLTEAGIECKR